MPQPGKCWRHVIINTRNTWLRGDKRGFRDRDHRIHSSGDYKNPPPPEEHAGLRRYYRARSGPPVIIPISLRRNAGLAFLARLRKLGYRVLAISVSGAHLHALVELPDHRPAIRSIIGRCKRDATEAMRPKLSGKVWSQGGEFKRVRDKEHQENAYGYILTRQGADAWTWSYRDELGLPRLPVHRQRR